MPMAAAQELTMPPTTLLDEPTPARAEAIPAGPTGGDPSYGAEGPMMAPDPLDFHGYNDKELLAESTGDVWGFRPALTESTGTWLRRGWWYTEIDAVVLNRQWKRDDKVLANDTTSFRRLHLNRTDPGAEGSVRLTLGRFLFRDVQNRDHTMEFTAFGGGQASQDDVLSSAADGQTLDVPFGIDFANLSFDGAQTMSVDYDSRFTSFEVNYRVKERMRRDRMVLTPSGEWVRTANQGVTKQFLMGLRYFDLEDILEWRATNIGTFAGEDANYHVDTSNDMFGLQLGCSLLLEHDRWNLELMGKGGPYLNDAKADSSLNITNNTTDTFVKRNRESTLAFVGEFQLIGRYHLRPNVSLRAGWQMMYLTSVALAPDQIDFSPDEGRFPYTGDPFYNGAIFGLESYW
jgi:hypothetical protein